MTRSVISLHALILTHAAPTIFEDIVGKSLTLEIPKENNA